jgi:hypothetical protein
MNGTGIGSVGGAENQTLTVAQIPASIPVSVTGTANVTSNNLGGLSIVTANGISSAAGGGATISGQAPGGFISQVISLGTITGYGTASVQAERMPICSRRSLSITSCELFNPWLESAGLGNRKSKLGIFGQQFRGYN